MLDPLAKVVRIPVCTPQTSNPTSGRVRNMPVSPQALPPCLEVRPAHGDRPAYLAVRGAYYDRGYRLLQELYEQDGNPEGWAKYQRYLRAWGEGTARVSFPVADLPKEAQRRMSTQLVDREFGGEFVDKPEKPEPPAKKGKSEG